MPDEEVHLPSSEEIEKKIAFFESDIVMLNEIMEENAPAVVKLHEIKRAHLQKYGTFDSPKLTINPAFQQKIRTDESFPFTHPNKNEEYRQLVARLFENILWLQTALKVVETADPTGNPPTDLLVELPALKKRDKRLKSTYELHETLTLDTPIEILDFISYVAEGDFDLLSESHSFFDELELARIAKELKNRRPDLFEEAGEAEVMSILDPVLRKVVLGYPETFPDIRIHVSREEFSASWPSNERSVDVAAYHSFIKDTVESHRKPKWELLCDLAHECGHPIARSVERSTIDAADTADSTDQILKTIVELDKEMITLLRRMQGEKNAEKVKEVREQFFDLQEKRNAMVSNSEKLGASLGSSDELHPKKFPQQIDEGAAYTMQGILLRECFADDPETLRLIMQLRDFENFSREFVHYAGFAFAKERLRASQDPVRVMRDFVAIDTQQEVDAITPLLEKLSADAQIHGGVVGELEDMSRRAKKMQFADAKRQINENVMGLLDKFIGENRTDFPEKIRREIPKRERQLAEDFSALLDKTFHQQK